MDREQINLIVQGQSERNILEKSKATYLSKCKVMTRILNNTADDIRRQALVLDAHGKPLCHSGKAKDVFKLQLPMDVDIAKILFALISVDDSLPKKRKRVEVNIIPENIPNDNNPIEPVDPLDIGKNRVTVTAQTYQNYKSALIWWHEFHCPAFDKVGVIWPRDCDSAIGTAIASYKREVGEKKRKGIMRQQEGKNKYNLFGYITICKHFMKMRPVSKKYTWSEGMFAGLFTKLSVNTIGRSDNIDDVLLTNIGWQNDALTIRFGTTKADQTGDKTSDIKRIYANPFKPEIVWQIQVIQCQ